MSDELSDSRASRTFAALSRKNGGRLRGSSAAPFMKRCCARMDGQRNQIGRPQGWPPELWWQGRSWGFVPRVEWTQRSIEEYHLRHTGSRINGQ
jgi:hypothetical protein